MGEIISIETLRLWHEQEKENVELQERIKKAKDYVENIETENEDYNTHLEEIIRILKGEK